MSERGSFVTEFIYCPDCLAVCLDVLIGNDKGLQSVQIPSWIEGQMLPIIAGKIGGLGSGDELFTMQYEIGPILEHRICHSLRVAVLADNGVFQPFTFNPGSIRTPLHFCEWIKATKATT